MDLALEVGTDAPADVPAADEPIDALVVLNNLFRVDSFKPLLVEALIDDLRGSADVAARLIDDYYVALGVGNYGPAEGLTREACVREYPALARIVDLLVGYADVNDDLEAILKVFTEECLAEFRAALVRPAVQND